MKLFLVFGLWALAFLCPSVLPAQRVSPDYILDAPETKMDRYPTDSLAFYHLALPFSYSSDSIHRKKLTRLRKEAVYRIDLVYSDYRSTKTFSQEALNRRRIEALQKTCPFLFRNTAIEWRLVRQMDAETKAEASKLFHGFVFHLRSPKMIRENGKPLLLGLKEEKDLLRGLLGDTLLPDYPSAFPTLPVFDTLVKEKSKARIYMIRDSVWQPARLRRELKGMTFDKKGIWRGRGIRIHFGSTVFHFSDTTITKDGVVIKSIKEGGPFRMDPLSTFALHKDSVVYKTLSAHPEWKNVLVVEDVTGSMFPYIDQTLAWRRLAQNARQIKDWAFFNDGDRRPDGPIGKSNGVYYIHSDKEKPVEERCLQAMSRGNGGGIPENDIEAMLKSLKQCRTAPEAIILIADNFAPVRDIRLFKYLEKRNIPVYVIVCGAYSGKINLDYLEIARRTKGKIFTLEGELKGLLEVSEGETIKVGKQHFRIEEGNLVLVRSM